MKSKSGSQLSFDELLVPPPKPPEPDPWNLPPYKDISVVRRLIKDGFGKVHDFDTLLANYRLECVNDAGVCVRIPDLKIHRYLRIGEIDAQLDGEFGKCVDGWRWSYFNNTHIPCKSGKTYYPGGRVIKDYYVAACGMSITAAPFTLEGAISAWREGAAIFFKQTFARRELTDQAVLKQVMEAIDELAAEGLKYPNP